MLMDTLVISQFYTLPIWGPSLGTTAVSRLQRFCNRAVRVTCGLQKHEHVSAACYNLGWYTIQLKGAVSYPCSHVPPLCSIHNNCVQLDPCSYCCIVLVYMCLYWQGRTAVANCQINNQSIINQTRHIIGCSKVFSM